VTALATAADVEKRLGEDEITDGMRGMIEVYLEDASDVARYYGRDWTELDCPLPVSRMVAAAVARFMRNPERLSQSRAGDETLAFQDSEVDWFTDKEIERLGKIGNPRVASFGTIQLVAFGHKRRSGVGYVPWGSSDRPFPLYAEQDPFHPGGADLT